MAHVADNCLKTLPQRSPGYLMAPFGWAAKPLAAMLEADPSLYPALSMLSRRRMHLIALALAHWSGEIEASFAQLLMLGDAMKRLIWRSCTKNLRLPECGR